MFYNVCRNKKIYAVFFNLIQCFCIINKRVVKVGDSIQGAKVVSISSGKVLLNFQGEPMTLLAPD